MYICSHDTFLGLKIVKNGYCGNEGINFAWDLGAIFLGIPDWVIGWFLKKNFGLEGVMEKCVGCFLVYLFFFFAGGGGY